MEEKQNETTSIKTVAFCCAVFATFLYLNTLSAEFAYDDNRAILRNPDLLPETPITNIFFNDFWGTPLTHSGSHKSYRPICVLTFRLNYAIHALDPFGYHLVNVLCHALVTALFVLVTYRITGRVLVATLAGILFACHPIHTEAVAGIVGRADLLACLFFLLALLCYVDCCKAGSQSRGEDGRSRDVLSWMRLCGVAVCSAGSMLCKEQGLTVLVVCAVYDLFLLNAVQPKSLLCVRRLPSFNKVRHFLILLTIGLLLLILRLILMGCEPPEFAPADNPASESDSLLVRCLTFWFLPCLNFALLLCPILLSFDWSMDAVALIDSFTDSRNVASIFFYTLLAIVIIHIAVSLNDPKPNFQYLHGNRSLHDNRDIHDSKAATLNSDRGECLVTNGIVNSSQTTERNRRLQCFCFAFVLLVVPFIPASNLFFYVGFVIAERILYIPSMGFCLLIAQGFCCLLASCRDLSRGRIYRRVLWLFFASVVVSYSWRTIRRNVDWQTEESLYRSGLSVNPAKAWGNLGNILKAQGKLDEAEFAYKSALLHRSNMADVYYNLGLFYQEKKRYDESIQNYLKAIEYRPKLTVAYLNLGLVYEAVGLKVEAEKLFRDCFSIDVSGLKDPRLHEQSKTSALYNLGRLLADDNRLDEAVKVYRQSIEIAPSDYQIHSIYNMLGEAFFRLGDHSEAERNYRHALRLKSDHIPAYLTMAKLFQAKNELSLSEDWLRKALSINPSDTTIYRHYGQFLSESGRTVEAVEWLLKAVNIDPEDFETVFNCANALRQSGRSAEAEEFYREAVRLNPMEVVAKMNLGAILHFNGKLREAEAVYLDALKTRPDDAIIRTNLKKLHKLMTLQPVT